MLRIPHWLKIAIGVFGVAMIFAWYTQHAWEDYWITFRSSRNLAEGHGLVFNVGDRLHTFTSPLGVLLPTLAYWLTLNTSDYGALWIFRVMSALALGGAAGFLFTIGRQQWRPAAVGALVILFVLDAKTIDFSINGMETGFLLLFLAWTFYALFARPASRATQLGLAWTGLMWTRPDSFIYIGALALGALLFDRRGTPWQDSVRMLGRAGLITTALYLPWLIIAGLYYGTPLPHTIVAKGLGPPLLTWPRIESFLAGLPGGTWRGTNSFAATFLPSYYMMGGWPEWMIHAAGVLCAVLALMWLLPVAGLVRAASLTLLVGHLYLSFAAYFPFPWYLPTLTCCAAVVLAGLFQQACSAAAPGWRGGGMIILAGLIAVSGWLTINSARQLAAAQTWVEDGNRKQIGLYLREHARKGETVFLEPLGYIGYFSQLETFDFPGMSSRKMVAARRKVANGWADLINELNPSWLVLRDSEIVRIRHDDLSIFAYRYVMEKEFDVSAAINALDIAGRGYLEVDRKFTLWRRQDGNQFGTPLGMARGYPAGTFLSQIEGHEVMFLHAPAELQVEIPAGVRTVTVHFGFFDKAFSEDGPKTDGSNFQVIGISGNRQTLLWERNLRPTTVPVDRGLKEAVISWPEGDQPQKLLLKTSANETIDKDWAYWGRPEFR